MDTLVVEVSEETQAMLLKWETIVQLVEELNTDRPDFDPKQEIEKMQLLCRLMTELRDYVMRAAGSHGQEPV